MNNQEKRQRLIAMRECLREVQQRLPRDRRNSQSQYICIQVRLTLCDDETKSNTRRYVMQALRGYHTFNTCIQDLNPGRNLTFAQIMTLRRRWIGMLCARLTREIKKLS